MDEGQDSAGSLRSGADILHVKMGGDHVTCTPEVQGSRRKGVWARTLDVDELCAQQPKVTKPSAW